MKILSRYIVPLFVVLPLISIIYLSLVSVWTFPDLLDAQFTGKVWGGLFTGNAALLASFGLSLFISGTLAVVATAFGYFISKFLLFELRKRSWIQLAFYPYLIAPVILGAMLQFYFVRWGLTGTVAGIMIAQAFFILPYSVLLLSTFWTEQLRQLAFQAYSLGANSQQVNREILFPMAKPWLLLSLVQCFLISWFEYGMTQLIGVGKINTLTISTMRYVKEADPHQAALSACLMIIPVLIILVINQRLFRKRTAI